MKRNKSNKTPKRLTLELANKHLNNIEAAVLIEYYHSQRIQNKPHTAVSNEWISKKLLIKIDALKRIKRSLIKQKYLLLVRQEDGRTAVKINIDKFF